MTQAGISLPEKFDMAGVFSLVMQVLETTYAGIRAKIVKGLGKVVGEEKTEKAMSAIETGVDIVQRIIVDGPIALWEMAKDSLGDLRQLILTPITEWVQSTIVGKAVAKVVSMLNPAGAIYQAAMMVYDVITFFMNQWERIKSLVNKVFDSLALSAVGAVSKAGTFIENAFANGLSLAISFLAKLAGLGGITERVKGVINKVRAPVTKAIDKSVDSIIKVSRPVIDKALGFGPAFVINTKRVKRRSRGLREVFSVKNFPSK